MPSRRSPALGSFQPPGPQRCWGGERGSPHAAGLLQGRRAPDSRVPDQRLSAGVLCPADSLSCSTRRPRQRRVSSPAPGPWARPGLCRAAFPWLPGTMLGAPQNAACSRGCSPRLPRGGGLRGSLLYAGSDPDQHGSPASITEWSEEGSQGTAALIKDAPGVCPASAATGLQRTSDIPDYPRNIFLLSIHLPHVFHTCFIL